MKIQPRPAPVLDPILEGEMLEALAPIEPTALRSASMKARVLAEISAAREFGDFITIHAGEGEWRALGAKVFEKRLVDARGNRSVMLRLEPGAILPPHDHPMPEESIVLEGEVWLGDVFCRAGDFHFAPAGRRHGAIRSDTGCVLYVRTGGGQGKALL